ncbi:MAG: type II/IV secretion system protein [Gammaproteobacteria bacterium]|jgi:MSHA biogenesis protein MshE|nr:type II/IV secretion system protein [Gammaproteobacteria bacterium]MBT5202746.1 type II/IV secretion system protein [Gammaproteobacteria bacterium]MBT5604039.1 type II/IV secretion system protein [Gammaproteobacteria bacterium]MBT6246334.1 type II/IV secretion system protein [Gammaproteobacteria bacterium]
MRVGSQKIRIGDLLMERGIITETQLQHALSRQRESDKKLGRLLIEDNVLPEDKFLEFLSEQLDVPFVGLRQYRFDPELVIRLAESHARRHRTIVLSEANGTLLVGMADPLDIFSYDEISRLLKQNVDVALVRESELMDTLDTVYRRTSEIESYAVELESEVTEGLFDLEGLSVGLPGDEAPVVKMLQSIFEDAVQVRASDIHIEPDEGVLRIRQRVDGILQEQVMKEQRIGAPLVLRLKLMSGLNISEKRLPQDGRFSLLVREKRLDVRLSTMPIEHGESVVMRLLDQSTGITELDETGMSKVVLSQFRDLIHMPYGLILVTGPTGSGKTTTLYGALNELNQAGQKIITAEDPVEYKIARINQVQVNPLIGLDFASVLRASLRQDPDILLVGEIRDSETAEIALRAAMTGHLVLSTLHTNDAISSATRLMDMGVEPFLAASSLRAIVAQRLVRKLCDNCARPHEANSDELSWLGRHLDDVTIERANLMTTVGCPHCNESGFRGRMGVFELLLIKGAVADALRAGDAGLFIEEARQQPGYQPLIVSALELAVQGLTTVSEVLRVAQQVEQEAAFTNTGGLTPDDSQLALL